MEDKRTAIEYILLIAMCLVFVGLAQFAGCFCEANAGWYDTINNLWVDGAALTSAAAKEK